MSDIIDEIITVVARLQIPSANFKRCEDALSQEIYSSAKSLYVCGNPRVWWLSLCKEPHRFRYPDGDGYKHLSEHVPKHVTNCWFIPEVDDELPVVFDATIEAIISVLENSIGFEYYLVGKDYDWLIIETDHNDVLVVNKTD